MRNRSIIKNIQELNKVINSQPGISKPKVISKITLKDYISDEQLRKVVEKLFNDGHHARAVEEAFKYLNNYIKKKANSNDDGSKLMKFVFSANNSVIKLNSGSSTSEKDEQLGYMEIYSGCMTGIRNPRAHEHDWEDTQKRAIQLLVLADHLLERAKNATI